MTQSAFAPWRVCFAAFGIFVFAGGPKHPQGTMAEMLAHPDWVLSHLLMLAAFASLFAGLILRARPGPTPVRTRGWLRFLTIATGLEVLEMAVHTAAVVDHQHLVAGAATPVLSVHLAMAAMFYPVFGVALIGFILAAARERFVGSPLIGWIGILGAAGHGLSAPLVIVFNQGWAGLLFPTIVLAAIWALLAAVWPSRAPAPQLQTV
jgi:hypothetical protein